MRDSARDSAFVREIPLAMAMELFDSMTFPDSFFPYAGLHADSVGLLWVRDNRPTDDGADRRYQLFDTSGAWLGEARLPNEIGQILEIGNDYILSVRTDEFDVPYLRVSRILR
jgi:hypothetical protein